MRKLTLKKFKQLPWIHCVMLLRFELRLSSFKHHAWVFCSFTHQTGESELETSPASQTLRISLDKAKGTSTKEM